MNLDENVKVASVAKVHSQIVEEELQKLEGNMENSSSELIKENVVAGVSEERMEQEEMKV